MKIVQLNFWLGNLMHPALHFLKEEDPDIICAQEILSCPNPNPLYDTFQLHEHLSELFPYQFFAPTYTFSALGETVTLGNAVYSRYPISSAQVVFTHGSYKDLQTADDFTRNIRNIQTCTITLPDGKQLHVANHHGYHDVDPAGTATTVDAMRITAHTLSTLERPLIFCGDLNINPTASAMDKLNPLGLINLTSQYNLKQTLSSVTRVAQEVACDYVLVSEDIRVQSFGASDAVVSDHKPLFLEFDI